MMRDGYGDSLSAAVGRAVLFAVGVLGVSAVSFASSAAAGYGFSALAMAGVRRLMRNR